MSRRAPFLEEKSPVAGQTRPQLGPGLLRSA